MPKTTIAASATTDSKITILLFMDIPPFWIYKVDLFNSLPESGGLKVCCLKTPNSLRSHCELHPRTFCEEIQYMTRFRALKPIVSIGRFEASESNTEKSGELLLN
jgi:hypothetical protein